MDQLSDGFELKMHYILLFLIIRFRQIIKTINLILAESEITW